VEAAIGDLREAIAGSAGDPRLRSMARFRMERLEQLASLCRVGLSILKALIDGARADVNPLRSLSEALSRRSLGPLDR
jgi:hypothetical protein